MCCSYKNSFNDFKIKIPFTFLSRHIYFLNACCRSSFEQIICAYVSLAFCQLKHHNWNFLVTHAQDISNLVHVHPTPASLHSSASIFECNAHISISNQQPMHWTKSLSYIFFVCYARRCFTIHKQCNCFHWLEKLLHNLRTNKHHFDHVIF